jgi:hypothetical protein
VCGLPGCGAAHRPGEGAALRICASCRVTAYCGAEHQRLHWKAHKKLCAPKPK